MFRPVSSGCYSLSVVLENTIGRVEKKADKMICVEEKISDLQLTLPNFIETGESANLTVSISK